MKRYPVVHTKIVRFASILLEDAAASSCGQSLLGARRGRIRRIICLLGLFLSAVRIFGAAAGEVGYQPSLVCGLSVPFPLSGTNATVTLALINTGTSEVTLNDHELPQSYFLTKVDDTRGVDDGEGLGAINVDVNRIGRRILLKPGEGRVVPVQILLPSTPGVYRLVMNVCRGVKCETVVLLPGVM
jgi:hypothetical protein